ncbi:MAG: ATP-binding protein, partial [Myxococcota bacterium]|nr:ATP-binding protein [Myxococcota bacterium]
MTWSDAFKRKLTELGLEDFEGEPSLDQWRQLLDGIEGTLGAPVSPVERRRAATEDLFHSLYPTFDAITRDLEEAVLLLDSRGRVRRSNPKGRVLIEGIDPSRSARIQEILSDRHGEVDPDLAIDLEMILNEHVESIEGRLDDIGSLPNRGPISYILSPLVSGGPAVAAAVIRDHTETLRLQTALEEAEERAGNSSSEQSAFVANTSHELRTPLNGILGMTQLLADTKLSTEQREFVEIIASSSESLLTLVNDILDFSKMEAGRLSLESIDFNIRDVIDQVVKLLVEKAAEQNIELVVLFEEGVPTMLRGDPVRLRQVIVNLLGNAIKFTHHGEVSLTVRSMGMTQHVADLRFDIRDSGIGIESEVISRLFEPFSQADETTTRKYGGTGLGLAICRQLVAMMGGEISADSVMGEGSLFWFTGRFDKQPNRDVSYTLVEAPADLFDQRILLIEDNETAATFIQEILDRWGLRVTVAKDAPSARQALNASDEAFPLVLADLGLPDASAYDLIRELRACETLEESETRVLLMGPPSILHEGL